MRIKTSNRRREILLFPPSLEEVIAEDNLVRLIDAFVDKIDLASHGFTVNVKKTRSWCSSICSIRSIKNIHLRIFKSNSLIKEIS